ncbi:MAG TPA: GGDEF domain-containing protein [Bacillota bacterium]|nr:GGDEF domain-containing protein [Bacillota bacterium]HPF42614.1 GGDEF domain-containing protein [Bacillota bacterium]HPJ86239.1 GGDEF domain-containing protein [Bacillota bacterium]HPQ62271.1 GGDEF domain-containing protein [Bacillota bacterium]
MKFFRSVLRKISGFFGTYYDENEQDHYDVAMGIVSASIIAIFEIISFIAVDPSLLRSKYYFLLTTGLMIMQLVLFSLIHAGAISFDSWVRKATVHAHPYLIVSVGIIISFAYQGYSNQIYSFIIAVFATSLVQLYPLWKRLSVFLYALIAFNLMIWITEGFQHFFTENLRLSVMSVVLAYVFTLVQSRSDLGQRKMTAILRRQNTSQEEALGRLRKAYDDIELNYRITEMMLTITSEMLNTDFFDDVLQMILEEAVKAVPKVSSGSILILNGEMMEYRASVGYDLKTLQRTKLKYKDVFQSDLEDPFEPTIIRDLQKYDEKKLSADTIKLLRSGNALGAMSVLTCSFKHNGKFMGSINLDSDLSDSIFDESDKQMIKQLAKQIEIIITIHELYGDAIRRVRYDYLTDACSRSYHQELLKLAYNEAIENKTPLAICSIDINNLKEVNDSFGHEAGDDLLIHFADGVRKNAGNNFFLSRVGGDEFFLVFPNATEEKATDRIKQIRDYFNDNPFMVQGNAIQVVFGCGVVCCRDEKCDLDMLVKLSDAKMYQNKAELKKQKDTIDQLEE